MEFPPRNSVTLVGGNALLHGLQLHTTTMSGVWAKGVMSFSQINTKRMTGMRRVPFIRGIVIVFYNLGLMLRNKFGWVVFGLAAFMTILVSEISVETKKLLSSQSFSPTLWDNVVALALLLLVLVLIVPRMLELFQWHGAEHMLIDWCKRYNQGEDILPQHCSKYCRNCGSVLAVYSVGIYLLGLMLTEIAPIAMLLAFSLGYEIFTYINSSNSKLSTMLFVPPRLLQHVICLQPTEDQLMAGLCIIKVFENSQYVKDDDYRDDVRKRLEG